MLVQAGDVRRASFFSELDEILGFRPASIPPVLLDSCNMPELQLDLSDAEDGDNSSNGKIYTILCRVSYSFLG